MAYLTQLAAWQALVKHQQEIASYAMRDMFAQDSQRFARFSVQFGGITFDYSRNRITPETLEKLSQLAGAIALPEKIQALFSGQFVNSTEARPALHMALRGFNEAPMKANGQPISTLVEQAHAQTQAFVKAIHSHAWRGMTGKP